MAGGQNNIRRIKVLREPTGSGHLVGLERTPGSKRCPLFRVMESTTLNNKPVVVRDGALGDAESAEAVSLADRALLSVDTAYEIIG